MPGDHHQHNPGDDQQAQNSNDEWIGLLSEDGRWRWDGEQWQPVEESPPPAQPSEPTPTPSEQQPGAWPTPWGDLSRESSSQEPQAPEDSSPPITRASLFGRQPGTSEPAPPAGEARDDDANQARAPEDEAAARPATSPADENEPQPGATSPEGPSRPMQGPAPFGRKSLEPPLIDPVVRQHHATPSHHGGEETPPAALPNSVPPSPPLPVPMEDDHRRRERPSPAPAEPGQEHPASTSHEMTEWSPSPPGPPQSPPEPPPTAAAITSEHMMRRTAPAPDSGVRRMLFNVSKGRINLGPSGDDVRRRQLLALVRTRVNSCRRIAVISRKGGIGKTTTTLMLGHQFASVRGDRVVALDANPDAGSLADRVVRETESTVMDILRHGPELIAYSDVRAFTSQAPSRLEIVATDNDPRISDALGEDEYAKVMDVLARHYSLIMCDTGTGILDSATRGILNMADQIVVCAAPSLDASRVSASTLDWLEQHGYGHLARDAVVAINAVRQGGPVELDLLQKFFERRCRAVVRIPWDPRLSAGAETTLEELSPATRTAYLNLAAMVAAGFAHS